jgi:hypothetical protein
MKARALHLIVLAGVLLALPAVIAWSPVQTSRSASVAAIPAVAAPVAAQSPSTILLPIEIAEQGSAPVQKQIAVQVETVPEPSSLLLLTASSLLLLRRRRSN